jgi:two-component system, chemotaxis family, chemotaxis protein CheY
MESTVDVGPAFSSPLTCLIVDDSAFARFHLKRLIQLMENVQPSEAANGTEAISEYRRLKPDFVLMDIVMPGLEGVETVRRICESDPFARVIMISSVSHQEKVKEALDAGASYFLPKPVTPGQLKKAIDEVLKTNRA